MLLVSIHDVAPPFLPQVRWLRDRLHEWGVAHTTLLAVPDFHRRGALHRDGATCAWLRDRAAAGDEIALHGYYHIERIAITGPGSRLRSRLFSAGEAEFLSLDPETSEDLLRRGRAQLQDILGIPIRGFVAPAWQESRFLSQQLHALGFQWHETNLFVAPLAEDSGRIFSPVIGFATRTPLRLVSSLLWGRTLTPILECRARMRPSLIRVALHPGDLTSSRVMSCAEYIIRRLARGHRSVTTEFALAQLAPGNLVAAWRHTRPGRRA
ncbi:MAG: polysaccharide deacetylase family protein [Proteobacteria bacterium]|nr:polysaccharide deacetylase family protein [Pseudomonadota bacterium]